MLAQIIMYSFCPITLLATFLLFIKLRHKTITYFLPAIVSTIFAVLFYAQFLFNNGLNEFVLAIFFIGTALANLFFILVLKVFKMFRMRH
ncbi:hypothetical protein CN373_24385 [Bacillus cereus]|uniref:Uncharacterized protein n=1 Tax=Bacillus cereus TaxID=1396 RepID=A0AA44Q653_BACCE|nr:hypothetical protein [Bacillus mycoides]PFA13685.1 hypothetical protein CN373_24385 [Bacillus cereus]PFN09934.1 hypothetical protein COJ55_01645 [Bacillus cereus]PFO83996.1 hypothetical protein COJ77_06530 [Bacillus cereus]PFR23847.1 hypothetical protein COK19_20015 [Bacillus cereus]PFR89410.1 hypothetical protein COK38_24325 [Bacillus cereus]